MIKRGIGTGNQQIEYNMPNKIQWQHNKNKAHYKLNNMIHEIMGHILKPLYMNQYNEYRRHRCLTEKRTEFM